MSADAFKRGPAPPAQLPAFIGVYPRFFFLAVAVLVGCSGLEAKRPLWSFTGPTMGTQYSVSVIGGEQVDAERLQLLVDERLEEVNRRMSTYDPRSELSQFNASDSTEWFEVSEETASVASSGLELARDSGGAYDPTVGPLVNLWGFGPGKRRESPPSDDEIAEASDAIGSTLVNVRLDPPALRKSNPAVYVDLSSIAKGHGVDAIANLLVERGVKSFMVEIGGEVRAYGTKPGGKPWRIGVEKVDESFPAAGGSRRFHRVVELVNQSMATSGDYRNFFEHEEQRYSHTINPTTGRPVTHNLATVTVIADSCRKADGLATALLVLGPRAGYDWAVERGVAVLMVSRGEDDRLIEKTTPAWDSVNAEVTP